MKVLSLLQPWASLLFVPVPGTWERKRAKEWETRSWKPSEHNLKQIQKNGMLIHASQKFAKQQKDLLNKWPFNDYIKSPSELPTSAIIGWLKVGEILTTEAWKDRFSVYEDGAAERHAEEYYFGDYSADRFAWQIIEVVKFKKPIENVKGALSLWDCPADILEVVKPQITNAVSLPR